MKCGYTKHVEVAHIRAIKSFPDSATITQVNRLDNLLALCPNCHWEFDNGYLDLEEVINSEFFYLLDSSQPYSYDGLKQTKGHYEKTRACETCLNETTGERLCRQCLVSLAGLIQNNKLSEELGLSIVQKKKMDITRQDLEKLLHSKNFNEIGRMYGISGNAVKKQCKKFRIDYKIIFEKKRSEKMNKSSKFI